MQENDLKRKKDNCQTRISTDSLRDNDNHRIFESHWTEAHQAT